MKKITPFSRFRNVKKKIRHFVIILLVLKRPLHGKLKLANFKKLANSFLHTSNSRQICNMPDLFSVLALTYRTVKQKKRREETESGGEMERFGRSQFVRWFLHFLLFVFSVSLGNR